MRRTLRLVLLVYAICNVACEGGGCAPKPSPQDMRLEGASMVRVEGDHLVHLVAATDAPYLSYAPPHIPFEVHVGTESVSITATTAVGARIHAGLKLPRQPEPAVLQVGDRRWSVEWVSMDWAKTATLTSTASRRALAIATSTASSGALSAISRAAVSEALAAVDALVPELSPVDRVSAQIVRVKLTRRANPEGYRAVLEDWQSAAATASVASEQSRALRTLAFADYFGRRFDEARAYLDHAEHIDARIENNLGLVRTLYYRTLIDVELGNYRSALEVSRRAMALAKANGLGSEIPTLVKAEVTILGEVGRYRDAWDALERVRPFIEHTGGLLEGTYFNDRGFILARGISAGVFEADWDRVTNELERARSLLAQAPTGTGDETFVIANLAEVRLLAGDLDGCRNALALLESGGRDVAPYVRLSMALLRGHLALRSKQLADAQKAYREVLERGLAESSGVPTDHTWRGHYGLARVADVEGHDGRAVEHYLSALEHLAATTKRTQLETDRAAFIDDRRRLYTDAVESFIRLDRTDLAVYALEQSQAQAFQVLYTRAALDRLDPEARREWRRAMDRYQDARAQLEGRARQEELVRASDRPAFRAETEALRARVERYFDEALALLESPVAFRRTGTTLLRDVSAALQSDEGLLIPWSDRAWFAVRSDGVRVFRERPSGPWWDGGEATSHVYVTTAGTSNPWTILGSAADARRWLERGTVTFLPFASMAIAPSDERPDRAPVIVADPGLDLPAARDEGARVAHVFPAAKVLVGDEATRAVVLEAIDGARHFHFAGHGVLEAEDPWSTHLLLANRERLTLEDLFATRPRVGTVVLSGCDTGQTAAVGRTTRIGLPEAFLAGGARTVVATTRPISDEEARLFIDRFYAAGGADRPAEAYRVVALALSTSGTVVADRSVMRGARDGGSGDDLAFAYYVLGAPR